MAVEGAGWVGVLLSRDKWKVWGEGGRGVFDGVQEWRKRVMSQYVLFGGYVRRGVRQIVRPRGGREISGAMVGVG